MDNDDSFKPAEGSTSTTAVAEAPKKLNKLEQEELTYEKAYQKLVCVMWVSRGSENSMLKKWSIYVSSILIGTH